MTTKMDIAEAKMAATTDKTEDPNSIKAVIRESFLSLLDEQPYNQIRIADITARAGVARQTFYFYFPSKEELLLSFIDDIFDDFYLEIEPLLYDSANSDEINKTLYQKWYAEKTMLLRVYQTGIHDKLYKRFRNYILRTFGAMTLKENLQVDDPKLVDYLVDQLAGSAFHVLFHWLEDGTPYSPEAMSKIFIYFNSQEILAAFTSPKKLP